VGGETLKTKYLAAAFVTAAATMLSSCSGLGTIFVTATPTPTLTQTSSATSTVTPTATVPPTATATATAVLTSEALTSYEAEPLGFKYALRTHWYPVVVTEDNADALSWLVLGYPGGIDQNSVDMLIATDDLAISAEGYAPHFTVGHRRDAAAVSLPLDLFLATEPVTLERFGGTVVTERTEVRTNAHGVELGTIEWLNTVNGASSPLEIHCDSLYFKPADTLVIITLAAPRQFAPDLVPVFTDFVDSIELLQQ
jgi:hypothetical protein